MFVNSSLILHIGLSHNSCGIETREQFYLDDTDISNALLETKKLFNAQELLLLQTCHRRELYVVMDQKQFLAKCQSLNFFAGSCQHKSHLITNHINFTKNNIIKLKNKKNNNNLTTPAIKNLLLSMFLSTYNYHNPSHHQNKILEKHFYFGQHKKTITHLMRVVSSIDSVVVGETQITAQFKKALNISKKNQCLGAILLRLSQTTLATSKKIRHLSSVGEKSVSVASMCFKLTKDILPKLSDCHILIIGAGEMAKLCVQYAIHKNPKKLSLINRSADHAKDIASCYQTINLSSFDQLDDILLQTDFVICATSAKDYILTFDQIKAVMQNRKTRKNNQKKPDALFLCDLSMPRNIDPAISNLANVYLTDIDDLKNITCDNFNQRKLQAEIKATPIINQSTNNFTSWLKDYTYSPLIARFHDNISGLIHKEVNKTASKSAFKNNHDEHFNALAKSLSQKLTASFARTLKKHANTNTDNYIIAQIDNINPENAYKNKKSSNSR